MIVLVIIPFMLLTIAGFGYTIYSDVIEYKRGLDDSNESKPDPVKVAEKSRQIEFYNRQLEILRRIEKDAETAYNMAITNVKSDTEKNKYCMIVPQKMVIKHIREKDAAANKLLTARNKVNTIELKRAKLIIN